MGLTIPPLVRARAVPKIQITEDERANIIEIIRSGDYDLFDYSFFRDCGDSRLAQMWLDAIRYGQQKIEYRIIRGLDCESRTIVDAETGETMYFLQQYPQSEYRPKLISNELYQFYKSEIGI